MTKISPTREFYSNLPLIRDMHENQGYKKLTELFEVLKKEKNWQMSYKTFWYHFKNEFGNTSNLNSNKKPDSQISKNPKEFSTATQIENSNTKENEKFELNPKYLALGKEISQALKK